MIQDLLNNSYDNCYNHKAKPTDDSYIMYFYNNELLCHAKGNIKSLENAIPGKAGSEEIFWGIPTFKELNNSIDIPLNKLVYLFKMKTGDKEQTFFLLTSDKVFENTLFDYVHITSAVDYPQNNPDGSMDKNYYYLPALKFRSVKPLDISFAVITAWQLYVWYRDNKYCGRCGCKAALDNKERMVKCPSCGNMIYPKICPGVIVGIIHKGRILLTKYANKGYNRYALVAGFTEIGETLEESAKREAFEEVGLKLKNITFYKSQPWSASSSLLAGFFAKVDGSDEVMLETDELKEGTWFYPEDIVQMHEGVSLTEEMINYFADRKMEEHWYK